MAKRDNPRLRNENNKRSGKNTRAQKQQAAARKEAPKRERRPRPAEDRGYGRGFDDRSFEERNSNIIIGRNPVMEALKSGREIDKILVSAGDGSIVKIVGMAKYKGLPIIKAEKASLDRIAQGGAHQGTPRGNRTAVGKDGRKEIAPYKKQNGKIKRFNRKQAFAQKNLQKIADDANEHHHAQKYRRALHKNQKGCKGNR
jgi:hypothetical protein